MPPSVEAPPVGPRWPDDGGVGVGAGTGVDADQWGAVAVAHSPDGLAVLDRAWRVVQVNPAGARLLGRAPRALLGTAWPSAVAGLPAEAAVVEWEGADGVRRALACTTSDVLEDGGRVVAFRDAGAHLQQERRLAAMARAAFSVTTERPLTSTLQALAEEALQAASLAGVQVLLATPAGAHLHVLGTAGFGRIPDFFDRLLECQARGARLEMVEALQTGTPRVLHHRFDAIMADPAWAPLHDHMGATRWDAFASVPLRIRGVVVGVLNAFFAPGQDVGEAELGFLLAMADQAAVAVDHAELLQRGLDEARREERQRLARDLHDSVVQQVFSIMMQAGSLDVLARRGLPPSAEKLAAVAGELSSAAADALADLRGLVVELRPAVPAGTSIGTALRTLLEATAAREELRCDLHLDDPDGDLPALDGDLAEDVYRVVSEAVHNSVKHAGASTLRVELAVLRAPRGAFLLADVVDDGRGVGAPAGGPSEGALASGGYGMTAMRERAHRWGGGVDVVAGDGGGTRVRLRVPVVRAEARR